MNSWFVASISPVALLLAGLLSTAGMVLLYRCWRRKNGPVWLWIAWGIIVVSIWPWQRALGFDRGIAVAPLWLALVAFLLIAGGANWRAALRPFVIHTGRSRPAEQIPWGRRSLRWLLAGPLYLLATTGLVMGWFAQSQWSDANRLVGAALFLVILWPLAIVWSSADPRLWRPFLASVTALILGGCALFLRVGG